MQAGKEVHICTVNATHSHSHTSHTVKTHTRTHTNPGQVSACVASPVPDALIRVQAEKEFQAKLLELVQKGLARPEDVEQQLTVEALEEYIQAE